MSAKVVYPIGVKLNVIITLLLLFSLGAETLLVAVFVCRDVEKTAAGNNRNINAMTAKMVDVELRGIRDSSFIFLSRAEALRKYNDAALRELARFFFNEQPDIAGVIMPGLETGGEMERYLNMSFLAANESAPETLEEFLTMNPVAVSRARIGEPVILNAAPSFNGVPILVLIFPYKRDSMLYEPAAVFFSAQNLTESFSAGANASFLTSDTGDALVHHNQELIADGANLLEISFVRDAWNSGLAAMHSRFKDISGVEFFGDFVRLENFGGTGVFTTIQSSIVFEGIETATRRNIALAAGVMFLSILFIWFFSKTFSRPVVELTHAVRQIDAGNYHIHLQNRSTDETGILVRSVVSMSHVIENFERFTNKMIVRLSREGTLNPVGMDKTATLFFSDIRSFTAISEKLSAREIVIFLNAYMERMVRCINATGGTVDKFIGDAIMAHWGPVETTGSPEQDALSGVRSALLMRANLFNFNMQRRGGDKEPKIKIGCGLNTGNVLAGQIGTNERIVYTVIGEAVSFADRTETFNKSFGTEILITEHTWNYVKDSIVYEEMPPVNEGGQRVRIFAVINAAKGEESERLLAILDTMRGNDPAVNRRCIGAEGPQTLAELRRLLDIPEPDLSALNLDEEEKKYKIAGAEKAG
ncbi:MAG: adenylate/guanylate cyclase domain-containing protein [Spirochaetaceae bacterium]|jgi:adenylate cyclase|nr:adenylate/guanylate cyclase domain-containing protein [Spirochaetaceae bacterium]